MTTERSPRLAALDAFLGEWTVRPTPPAEWGVEDPDTLTGRVTFEWALDGAYLVQRSQAPDPIPDSTSFVAVEGDGYRQHYFDSRGVTRLYRMSLHDGVWTLERTEADFSPLEFAQRFVGTFTDDGRRIDGRWETSKDLGETWELDFTITYQR
jgi:hypothetical protein